jgi:hypothetical protein
VVNRTLVIVDDFLPNPDTIRDLASQQVFTQMGSAGKRSTQQFHTMIDPEIFGQLLGIRIADWGKYPINGRFQFCTSEDPIVRHADLQKYAGIIFLTPDAPVEAGLSLVKSRVTGARRMPPDAAESSRTFEKNFFDSTKWDTVDKIGNIYNRLVLWDAQMIHAASCYFGMGQNDGRLFWMFFFDGEPTPGKLSRTSFSDVDSYLSVCRSAATDDEVFKVFRRHPDYLNILEHVTPDLGQSYLDEINRNDPSTLLYMIALKNNDAVGSPLLADYAGIGSVSPTTLRYIKVATDLRKLFATLNNKRVVEIGGGYGGQAKIAKLLWPSVDYTIIDLPEPLMLIERYLSALGVYGVKLVPMHRSQEVVSSDILISNYAMTECEPSVMAAYSEICKRSAHGYITGNAEEALLFKLLKPVQPCRYEEVPRTGPNNFMCVW